MGRFFIFLMCGVFIFGASGNTSADDKGSMKGSKIAEQGSPELKGSHMSSQKSSTAVARITSTGMNSMLSGWVKFIKHPEGVKVMGYISGVDQVGKHGIHVHAGASCDNGGKAAGGHFNPHGVDHGFYPENGHDGSHLGDMGNIEIDKYGTGSFMIDLSGVEFDGSTGVVGHAVILHEKEDDFGQPTGNAGARIGCGLIEAKSSVKGEMKGSH